MRGQSSRSPEIMAAGAHSPDGLNGIIRSQSFAGFSTLQERRSRCNSFMGNSVVQKKPQAKPKKSHTSSHKSSGNSHEPQPRRVEEIYGALKRGLDEYLEVHQVELEKLTSLMKDMKRNSRLGVLYDLDKQIKAIERYVRRLEFHISKVDELYEAFCVQQRLRDGASKMKQAFSSSPSSRSTRESLAEVSRRYKEYNENMCTFEGELEKLLGEFHIKMKGLAGFARLCPGDQYEIFMRYGRQRWKLKGKIEASSRQSWDGEEMVFVPLISDLMSIKVSELKGLATHVLVGSVICETKDLFTAMPQVVAVDVNDLGTVKLNLEVTWFPFDVEDLTLSSGSVSKSTALQRRVSIYSQGTPETPTFQDSSFFSALRDDVFENDSCGVDSKRLSFGLSDPPGPSPAQYSPEIRVTPPDGESLSPGQEDGESLRCQSEAESEQVGAGWSSHPPALPGLNAEDAFLGPDVSDTLLRDEGSDLKPVELDTDEGSLTKQLVKRLTSSDMLPDGPLGCGSEEGPAPGSSSLEEAIQGLLLRLEGLEERGKELQELEQEVLRLEDLLKCRTPAQHSRSSSLSLTVESALESFDFLNTSDFDDDDTGDDGLPRSIFFDTEPEKSGSGQHPEARGHLSEALTEDTGVGNSVAGSPLPLTTGNESLDIAIIGHLQYCTRLIQLLSTGGSLSQHDSQLRKLRAQSQLLEMLGEISSEHVGSITSIAEVLPSLAKKPALLALWSDISGSVGLFHASLDRVLKHMHLHFGPALQERHQNAADTVIRLVVSEMVDRHPLPSVLSQDVLTVFQFTSYASAHGVMDVGELLQQLAGEVALVGVLRSGDPEQVLRELEEVPVTSLRPQMDTLTVLASLLLAENSELKRAASNFLSSAASHSAFRSKAVDSYTQQLCEVELQTLRESCAALSCLQASECIETLASLCDSADEELRHVAVETLLTLGEEGRLAYEQLDKVPREMVRVGVRRGQAVTTAF